MLEIPAEVTFDESLNSIRFVQVASLGLHSDERIEYSSRCLILKSPT
jgi:hypothetical protein